MDSENGKEAAEKKKEEKEINREIVFNAWIQFPNGKNNSLSIFEDLAEEKKNERHPIDVQCAGLYENDYTNGTFTLPFVELSRFIIRLMANIW